MDTVELLVVWFEDIQAMSGNIRGKTDVEQMAVIALMAMTCTSGSGQLLPFTKNQ
jgi:hypothetical protein